MTDEEVYQQYRIANGLDTVDDVGKHHWLKEARKKVIKKSGLYKLKTKQLRAIANKA